jgi:hypothetical protein
MKATGGAGEATRSGQPTERRGADLGRSAKCSIWLPNWRSGVGLEGVQPSARLRPHSPASRAWITYDIHASGVNIGDECAVLEVHPLDVAG